jgi:putative heme-binding domain-containing protein
VAGRAARVFPVAAPAGGTDRARRIAEVETLLKQGAGNPYEGEKLFLQLCANCHRLNFKGGNIGPDLTTYQRDNLGTMLPSIFDPNAEIREGFQYYLVKTKDGRSLSGFLVDRDSQITVLRGIEGADIALRDAEIETMQPVGRSLMPEGLLDPLSDQQLRDFFAYLRIAQPLTR